MTDIRIDIYTAARLARVKKLESGPMEEVEMRRHISSLEDLDHRLWLLSARAQSQGEKD